MNLFSFFQHRKIFLTALVLLLVSTMVLLAQNTPPKEATPAVTGQEQRQVDFAVSGEEYLIYMNGDKVMQYNPATGESTQISWNPEQRENLIYKGNLGEYVETRREVVTFHDKPGVTGLQLSGMYTSPLNGNTIKIEDVRNNVTQRVTIQSNGFQDFVIPIERVISADGEGFVLDHNLIGWIDKTHLLFSKGDATWPYEGVFILDITNGQEQNLLDPFTYLDDSPKISPSGRFFPYVKPTGEWDQDKYNQAQVFLYDFQTGKTIKLGDPGGIIGWTIKKIMKNPADAGFFSPESVCSIQHCLFNNPETVTFKMPFASGEVYRVSRDGECKTPGVGGCNLTPGNDKLITWGNSGSSAHHENRPALDFTDQILGGTTEDHLPVLAAAGGWVAKASWQNSNHNCVEAAGFGRCVYLKHTDGTFTLYGHMSSFNQAVVDKVANHEWVDQGTILGYEGHSGHCIPCDGEHIHLERRTGSGQWQPGGQESSYWMQFDELGSGKAPTDEYAYISKNGNYGMDCGGLTSIPSCGGTLNNETNAFLSKRRSTYWVNMPGAKDSHTGETTNNAASINMSGPEKIYQIILTTPGTITATLSNVSYSPSGTGYGLNVFILSGLNISSCANLDPLIHCVGTSNGTSATATNLSAGTYYIIVDGKAPNGATNGAQGGFTLTVNATCGGGFNCNNAVQLSNGVQYSGSNSGGGSNVTTYSCQSGWPETGPEKVYTYYHPGGTITVNFVQTGPDVDAFLLGSCSVSNCLLAVDNGVGTSTQPAGTYYIVVDGYQGAVGSYTLTVSSSGGGSGLNCNNPISLSNGVAYNGNNTGGGNNVTTYNCQSGWSETGPEKVHSYYHTGGTITINLAQSVDVDAFLLGSCSPTNCLLGFDNGVASSSQPAGTYYIVVDGYNGAVGSYTLTVSSTGGGGGGGLPNLTDNGSSRSPSGRNITITAEIKNDGTGNAGPASFRTRYVLSYDTYLGNDYHLVYLNYNNFTILSGGTSSYTFNWTIPSSIPAGTYYLMETLDYDNVIVESNENNSWYFSGAFYVPPGFSGGGGEESNVIGTIEVPKTSAKEESEIRGQGMTVPITTQQAVKTCEALVKGMDISVSNIDLESEYFLCNTLGAIVCQGKATDGAISCRANNSGIYFLSIVDGLGNKCVQKVFVN